MLYTQQYGLLYECKRIYHTHMRQETILGYRSSVLFWLLRERAVFELGRCAGRGYDV